MGWSFRKSKSFGPFRLNFSKSGVGLSFGVKGARISFSKRGTYVNLGANGIYYRQRIDQRSSYENSTFIPPPSEYLQQSNATHTITTEDLEAVTDVDSQQFIDELESKENKIPLLKYLGFWPTGIFLFIGFLFLVQVVSVVEHYEDIFTIKKRIVNVRSLPSKNAASVHVAKEFARYRVIKDTLGWIKVKVPGGTEGYIRADMGSISHDLTKKVSITRVQEQPWLRIGYCILALSFVAWCIFLKKLDKKRRTLELYYTLDHEIDGLHRKFLQYFQEFASSRKIWQNLHTQGVADQKYHAGATQLVSRATIAGISVHKLPSPYLETNVSIPFIGLRNTELYFFPERIILKRGKKFGAAFYKNIRIENSNVNFIEEQAVPADAQVIDYTWKYLNKSGGPDRRFSDNRQLPICKYSEYAIKSEGGIKEVITTSKVGAMDEFAAFIKVIGDFQKMKFANI